MKYLKQTASAMCFIHYCSIVHRDLKTQNILIDNNNNVKLCDFGLAKNKVYYVVKFKNELGWGSGKFSGTPTYMAPELFEKKAYDEKVDVFAFGTVMWEVLVRKVPYEGFEVSDIKKRTMLGEDMFIPKTVNPELGKLINSCRAVNPESRPTFKEIVEKLTIY